MGRIHLNPELRGNSAGLPHRRVSTHPFFFPAGQPHITVSLVLFPLWWWRPVSQRHPTAAACCSGSHFQMCAQLCHCWGKRTEQDQICTVQDCAVVAVLLVHDSCWVFEENFWRPDSRDLKYPGVPLLEILITVNSPPRIPLRILLQVSRSERRGRLRELKCAAHTDPKH